MVNVCPRESEYVKRKQHSLSEGEGYREIKNKRYCKYKIYRNEKRDEDVLVGELEERRAKTEEKRVNKKVSLKPTPIYYQKKK